MYKNKINHNEKNDNNKRPSQKYFSSQATVLQHASAHPNNLNAETLLQLQGVIGNQKVKSFLQNKNSESALQKKENNIGLHANITKKINNEFTTVRCSAVNNNLSPENDTVRLNTQVVQNKLDNDLTKSDHQNESINNQTDIIQRAVGFEFETPLTIKKATKWSRIKKFLFGCCSNVELEYEDMAKYQTAYIGNGWKLTADCTPEGSVIEFVTDPVDETAGPTGHNRLNNIMIDLTNYVINLNAQNANQQFTLDQATGIANDNIYQITIPLANVNQNIAANPQTTAGIRLDKLGDLAQSVNAPGAVLGTARHDLMGMDNGVWGPGFNRYYGYANAEVNASMPLLLRSDTLKGLVTLIISYIIEGAPLIGFTSDQCFIEYAKHITILMARTNFAAMYRSLPQAEKTHFTNTPIDWINLIIQAAARDNTRDLNANGRAGADGYLLERSISRDGVNFYQPNQLTGNITRRAWLNGIRNGRDLSSNFDTSMGGLKGKMDNVGPGQALQSPILEFRKMGQQIAYTDWTNLAIQVFDYISALNNYNGMGPAPNY